MNPPSNPAAVLAELSRQADRKASLKMYYAAADLFRDYRGPYAQETGAERERLATEFEERGRAAEKQRWEGGPPVPAPKPVTTPRPPPPPRPVRPPAATAPAKPPAKPVSPRKGEPQPKVEGGKIILPCRWCQESLSFDLSAAGKLLPCPKCDMLVAVPKLNP